MRALTSTEKENVKAILYQLLYQKENTYRKVGNKIAVIDTACYDVGHVSVIDCEEKKFNYTSKARSGALVGAAFFAVFLIPTLTTLVFHFGEDRDSTIYVQLFFLTIFIAGMTFCLKHAFSKKQIIISNTGIIHKEEYVWSEILGTYVIEKPSPDDDDLILVLTLTNGKFIYILLNQFDGFEIIAYVNYFKQKCNS